MKGGKNIIALLLTVVIIGLSIFSATVGIGESKTGSAEAVNLGLDLEGGGVSITYTPMTDDPTPEEIADTIYKLQLRLDDYGYTEGEIYLEGNNRINVDIPGVQNAEQVLLEMGKPGKLAFVDEDGKTWLTGADVENASPAEDTQGLVKDYVIRLELNDEGTDKFAAATKANVGRKLLIYYNDVLILDPIVNTEINTGDAVINHMGSFENASRLASNIRIGALPLELNELRSNVVGAKMGQDAIATSLRAGLIGIIIVFLFMTFFYRLPGFLSAVALAFYASLTIVALSVFGITLTLPGIAGIILSIGMAVDANVIIFSRIKEEIATGKTLKASVKSGFKKKRHQLSLMVTQRHSLLLLFFSLWEQVQLKVLQ